jgi:aspartyl/glutamyl-tRNA(Asn/Gln) amidotransferase C subunit
MPVTRADIQKIADLAELHVDETTAVELEAQLSRILDYVAQLSELPKEGPSLGDDRAVRLRPDMIRSDPLGFPVSGLAPAMKHGLFLVPRLGELDQGGEESP